MKKIETSKAPGAIGPYSQGMVSGKLVFTSGQIPLDPATGAIVGETIEAQSEQALKNLQAVLEAGGASLATVVKTTCFLSDIGNFAAFNGVYAKYFTGDCPARSCVAVKTLPKGVLVEVEAIAEVL
ncbi:MAG: RidA family protein [Clostridia bacterium]|nr:RidA family protein [Clostridia bacterium]